MQVCNGGADGYFFFFSFGKKNNVWWSYASFFYFLVWSRCECRRLNCFVYSNVSLVIYVTLIPFTRTGSFQFSPLSQSLFLPFPLVISLLLHLFIRSRFVPIEFASGLLVFEFSMIQGNSSRSPTNFKTKHASGYSPSRRVTRNAASSWLFLPFHFFFSFFFLFRVSPSGLLHRSRNLIPFPSISLWKIRLFGKKKSVDLREESTHTQNFVGPPLSEGHFWPKIQKI